MAWRRKVLILARAGEKCHISRRKRQRYRYRYAREATYGIDKHLQTMQKALRSRKLSWYGKDQDTIYDKNIIDREKSLVNQVIGRVRC